MTRAGKLDDGPCRYIYDTVADQSIWPSVLDRVADRLKVGVCILDPRLSSFDR